MLAVSQPLTYEILATCPIRFGQVDIACIEYPADLLTEHRALSVHNGRLKHMIWTDDQHTQAA